MIPVYSRYPVPSIQFPVILLPDIQLRAYLISTCCCFQSLLPESTNNRKSRKDIYSISIDIPFLASGVTSRIEKAKIPTAAPNPMTDGPYARI
jgi:hypothetical protein